jgi:hypothetical protein
MTVGSFEAMSDKIYLGKCFMSSWEKILWENNNNNNNDGSDNGLK